MPFQAPKTNWIAGVDVPTEVSFNRIEGNIDALAKLRAFPTATGTGTAIAVATGYFELLNGMQATFIASAANGAAATTLNLDGVGIKPLYKAGTAVAPNLIAGKAYTVWYNAAGSCFFIKASAEGTATTAQVLAGVPFSNESDTGLVGTIPSKTAATITPSGAAQTIAAGQYLAGVQTVSAVVVPVAKVLNDTTIAGQAGTIPIMGSEEYAGWRRADVVQASNAGRVHLRVPNGAYLGAGNGGLQGIFCDDPDFAPPNFRADVNMFGMQGSMPVVTADYQDSRPAIAAIRHAGWPDGVNYALLQIPLNSLITGANWIRSAQPDLQAGNIVSGKNIFGLVGTNIAPTYIPGDIPLPSAAVNSGSSVNSTIYVKATSAQGIIPNYSGTYRIKFKGYANSSGYACLYNETTGQYIGTERALSASYITYAEDIYVAAGHKIVPHVKTNVGGYPVSAQDLQFCVVQSIPLIVN